MPGILASESGRSKDRVTTTEVTRMVAIAEEEWERGQRKNEKKKEKKIKGREKRGRKPEKETRLGKGENGSQDWKA